MSVFESEVPAGWNENGHGNFRECIGWIMEIPEVIE